MTTDQKPWRAEMPNVDSTGEGCVFDWGCSEGDVEELRDRCNVELDAARAQVKLLESEAKRYASISAADDAYLAECSDELERAGVPVYDSQGVSRGLKCRIIELTRERDTARARIAELEAHAANETVDSARFAIGSGVRIAKLERRIAELEAAESANLRAIAEASGAMYEPDMGPTWPGSWAEQVSVIRGLRESQRYETERFLRIEKLLVDQCECSCDCSAGEHGEDCDPCFPCKVNAALRGVSL